MGCDIHLVIERKRLNDTKWTGIMASDTAATRPLASNRNYAFFAMLAGVRGDRPWDSPAPYPRYLPEDISELAWQEFMSSPNDHHTPGWVSLREFCEAYVRVMPEHPHVRKEFSSYDLFRIDGGDASEYRVVFWFDN